MVKNGILWFTFSLLMTVTSATACFAGKNNIQILSSSECLIDNSSKCNYTVVANDHDKTTKTETEKEPAVNKEASPSILNANFIFYIIYKYRFMEISNFSKDVDTEDEDKVSPPIRNFSNRLINFVYSFFEDQL